MLESNVICVENGADWEAKRRSEAQWEKEKRDENGGDKSRLC